MKNCYKNTNSTDTVSSTTTTNYSCSNGYELSADKTKCTKNNVTYTKPVSRYTCPDNTYKLSGTKCIKEDITTAKFSIMYVPSCEGCGSTITIHYYCEYFN